MCATQKKEGFIIILNRLNYLLFFIVFQIMFLRAEFQPFVRGAFIPDLKVKGDDYTVLMAVDAKRSEGLVPSQGNSHAKFYLTGWRQPKQHVAWRVHVAEPGDYAIHVLLRQKSSVPLRLEVTADHKALVAQLAPEARNWQRVSLEGVFSLTSGPHELSLCLAGTGHADFEAEVHAIELVRPAVRAALHQKALALRAETTWFQQARYGIMVHWTNETMPLQGELKAYDQAVKEFNVEQFADDMQKTGAGFVVFTTSHGAHYFPAPLASLDKILPGRTARRDLVADLADALVKRGMKLFLYYHLGSQADSAWTKASGFWDTDTTPFFNNWQALITEAGERYGTKLAGWWFDDGAVNYYYRSAPWEKLARAAKAGFPQRLVGFNAWELNSPTEFMDYFTGEGFHEPQGYNRLITPDCNGRYPSGTHAGLQSSACLIAEEEWGHFTRRTTFGRLRWNAEQLTDVLKHFIALKNVPIFNLEITQEGRVSPMTVELFQQVSANLLLQ